MTMTDEQSKLIWDMKHAHDAGKAWAEGLQVGDMFLGAFAEAKLLGFTDDRLRSVFTQAALDVFEHKVVMTDMEGILVDYRDAHKGRL